MPFSESKTPGQFGEGEINLPGVKTHLRVDSLNCILRMRIGKRKFLKVE